MTENQNNVPWIPGMRALDSEGHPWRLTTGGVWFPDDTEAHVKGSPVGQLTPDFADLATGAVVQWIIKAAEQREAALADPTHPANIMASLKGEDNATE